MFLLKPDEVVNQVMLFCLFRAAEEFGVLVHSVMVESNHFHAVVTDVRGELSKFMHWVDMMTAKNLIAHYESKRLRRTNRVGATDAQRSPGAELCTRVIAIAK